MGNFAVRFTSMLQITFLSLNDYIPVVLACQYFAPTTLMVTFERENSGRFTDEEINTLIVKDAHGDIRGLLLSEKSVLIANHQVRCPYSVYKICLNKHIDLCRLAISMVFRLFCKHSRRHNDRTEKEFKMGAHCGLGNLLYHDNVIYYFN